MYFSLVSPRVGKERAAAFHWLDGAYEAHQWLWKFFTKDEKAERDFLFRLNRNEDGFPVFYLLSRRMPKSFNESWEVVTKPYEPQVQVGHELVFSLRANPVVSKKVNEKSVRCDVVMDAKKQLLKSKGLKKWSDWSPAEDEKPLLYEVVQTSCKDWLEKRSEASGFKLLEAEQLKVDGYQQHNAARKNIKFSTVDFTGAIEVVDPELFQRMLTRGLGRSKAFGCGLFLVKPR